MSEDIVVRLRRTRANMIGTDDEEHYWDVHDAANEIESLRSRIDTADITHRLRRWSHDVNAVSASDLMDEAANVIESLRRELLSKRSRP